MKELPGRLKHKTYLSTDVGGKSCGLEGAFYGLAADGPCRPGSPGVWADRPAVWTDRPVDHNRSRSPVARWTGRATAARSDASLPTTIRRELARVTAV